MALFKFYIDKIFQLGHDFLVDSLSPCFDDNSNGGVAFLFDDA
jgi:hypothetical protein